MDFGKHLSAAWQKYVSELASLVIFVFVGMLLSMTLILIPTVIGGYVRGITAFVRDGRRPELSELWNFDQYLAIAGLMIVTGTAITVGYMFFIIPGVILSVWWMYALWFLVDGRLGVFDALGASRAAVGRSGFSNHFVVLLIMVVLGAAGGALAGFGTLLTMPFSLVFIDVVYLSEIARTSEA